MVGPQIWAFIYYEFSLYKQAKVFRQHVSLKATSASDVGYLFYAQLIRKCS